MSIPAVQSFLNSDWSYCFITEIERLGKRGIKSDELRKVKSLLSFCDKLHFSEMTLQQTIELRRNFRIKVPDAIIAATAIQNNLPLLTFDSGFAKIKALDLVLLK